MPQFILAKPAIGIHDDNDVGRVEAQLPHTELQCIALAAARSIAANRHFDACCPYYGGGVINAVIGDHEDAVVGSELGLNVLDGGKYSHSLVMGRNKYGRPM